MPVVSIQEVLQRLSRVKRTGDGYVALCPAHDDQHASLSIAEGERGVVVNCHAGCRPEDVVRAMDLEIKDLFYEGPPQYTVVAEYEYRDENDKLVYVVERRDPKDFRQRRPDGAGGWIWNLKETTPLPYRLPDILAAPIDEVIFIVEGEKDVEELRRRGFFATCNSGGAGKWRPPLSKWLASRHVIILPDNDEAGRKHAQQVRDSLAGVAADARIIDLTGLPAKGDVSDWFAAGHTSDELRALVPPIVENDVDRFVLVHECDEPPPQQWVWDGWIPKDFITTMYAMGGSSKSFLSQYIGIQIAMNQPIFGRHVAGGPVLFLDGELDRSSWLRRGFMFARGMKLEKLPTGLVYRKISKSLIEPKTRREVLDFVRAERPVLTIIDSFTACLPGIDTNSMDDIVTRMKAIEDLGSVLLIDHTKKTSEVGDSTPIGSVAKWNFARSAIQLSAGKEGGTVMKHTKSNFGKLCDPVAYTLNIGGGQAFVDVLQFSDARLDGVEGVLPVQQRIAHAFQAGSFPNGASSKDVAEALGVAEKTARNKLAQMRGRGLLTKDGRVWRSAPSPGWSEYEAK